MCLERLVPNEVDMVVFLYDMECLHEKNSGGGAISRGKFPHHGVD